MSELNFEKMLELQRELQERYKGKWSPICPETAKSKLLYLFIEAGEAADIIKKQGDDLNQHGGTRERHRRIRVGLQAEQALEPPDKQREPHDHTQQQYRCVHHQ